MIEEKGTVVEKNNGVLKLRLNRKEACEGCHACLAGESNLHMVAYARDTLGCQIGDTVIIQSQEVSKVKNAFILYIIPLVLFIPGFLLGRYWLGRLLAMNPEQPEIQLIGFILGCLFFSLPYIVLYLLKRKNKQDDQIFFETKQIIG